MLIYPAVDLRKGRCVRLLLGDFDAVTQYGEPTEQLDWFTRAGAAWAHVVDLDGAKAGAPVQHELVAHMVRGTDLKIQSGGGVRERVHVEALLEAGVSRVVIGSAAVKRPDDVRRWIEDLGVDNICAALDVRPANGGYEIAVHGWASSGGLTLQQALDLYPPGALKHALVTDVSRDGALTGPNFDLMAELVALRPDIHFQASGGVAQLSDLPKLRAAGSAGCIVGRALYEKRFTLEDALAC